ncbi:patatin-like phospholipase family protein [Nocardia asteroides]|uniref:patatin-like phospholipase family protein n=1 Tax=Nocardia asteroides TaxID=1824 RepID=UPI0037C544DC
MVVRVGVVLGGGAVQGGLWLHGALAGLAEETGWNPADAELLVGTSAGSMLATFLAAQVPPWLLAARAAGEKVDDLAPGPVVPRPARLTMSDIVRGTHLGGSLPLIARGLIPPRSATRLVVGALPRGVRDTGTAALIRAVIPEGWPEHDGLWCVACDYRSGRRVVFGRDPETPADVADAVAASCAVPGMFQPVWIGRRAYVDGGVHSLSNLDVVGGRGLDLVICLNPSSSLASPRARRAQDLAWSAIRKASGRRLGAEARQVRSGGTAVVLLQPTQADLQLFDPNWMRPTRSAEIIAQAHRSVVEQLRQSPHASMLRNLPASPTHMTRRPVGPATDWPPMKSPPTWWGAQGG